MNTHLGTGTTWQIPPWHSRLHGSGATVPVLHQQACALLGPDPRAIRPDQADPAGHSARVASPLNLRAGDELRGRQDLDLAPRLEIKEVSVAAHDHIGAEGPCSFEHAITCGIGCDDLERPDWFNHRRGPPHSAPLLALDGGRGCGSRAPRLTRPVATRWLPWPRG